MAFCLGLVEAGARLLVARQLQAAPAGPPLSRFDPELGWSNVPGTRRQITRDEYDVTLVINSHGLRGPERDYRVPAGVRRTLLLGDSFAEGYYADEPRTFRAVLEQVLDGPCGRHEVINGGVQGYSTDQEYLFYRAEGRKYGARLVLLLFYSNDLLYNTSPVGSGGEAKPYFDLAADGALVRRNQPVPLVDDPERGNRQNPRLAGPRPWRGSMALRLLSNRTVESSPRLHAALATLGLVEPAPADPPREFWPFGPGHEREVEDMWARTRALLQALKRDVEADGARLAVVYVPVRFEVNPEVWKLTRARYHLGRRWNPDRVPARLKAVCAELGIPVVDPREPLRRAEAQGAAYFTRDQHWNGVGNEVAAHAAEPLARELLACP